MLMVLFHLGDERFAVQAAAVVEIVPIISLTRAPQAPAYVAGLFNYRATVTPVIDVRQLVQHQPCRQLLSSRIILIDYDRVTGQAPGSTRRILGLMTERVTDVCDRPVNTSAPPVTIASAPFLGDIFYTGADMNQCLELSALLPAKVQEMLFTQQAQPALNNPMAGADAS